MEVPQADDIATESADALTSPATGEIAEQGEAGVGDTSEPKSAGEASETGAPADEPAPSEASAEALTSPATGEIAEQGEASVGDTSEPASAGEAAGTDAPADEPAPSEASAEAEEPKPILLWRPARFERGPRHHRERGKDHRHPAGADADASRRQDGAQGRRRFDHKGKPGRSEAAGDGEHRNSRRKGRHEGPHEPPHKGKPGFHAKPPREERPPRFDPDSPFAKLAALRDQLKK